MSASGAEELLRLERITKSFSGTQALRGVSFSLRAGEVRALAGENGAGKSTLIKIIAGIWPHGSYGGSYVCGGTEVRFRSARDAGEAGIAVIHQELALVPELTVGENIALGTEPARFGLISAARIRARAREALSELGLDLDPDRPVAELGAGERQLVEIAKALSRSFRVLVLDEPTASLSEREAETLLALVARLKARGAGIVYVSHRLKEIFRAADSITVLRDGSNAAEFDARRASEADLVRAMVGRDVAGVFPPRAARTGAPALEAEGIALKPGGPRIALSVREGEVLGLAGLVGSGRTELLETLFGLRRSPGARIALSGRERRIAGPAEAMENGLALVGEGRKETGLVPQESVRANVTLASLGRFAKAGLVDRAREREAARAQAAEMGVRCADPEMPVSELSGGNQQKAILARWAMRAPKVYLLDEPTRGVDVGAKHDIYVRIRKWTAEGAAVVLASSELQELIGLSDRILALSDKEPAGEFDAARADEETLMHAMTRAFRSRP